MTKSEPSSPLPGSSKRRRWRMVVIGLMLVAAVTGCAVWCLRPQPSIATALEHAGISDWASARAELDRILKQQPQHSEALLMLGDVLRAEGDRRGAVVCYQRILPGSSEYRQASWNHVNALLEMSDLTGAESQMLHHLDSFPDERAAWDELRWLCFNQFRTRDVDELSHWWLVHHPDDTRALVDLLLGVFRPQVPQEGTAYLQQVHSTLPGQVSVLRALAWAAWQSGRINASKRLLERVWRISPDDPRTRLLSAEILIEEQELEAAARTLGEKPIVIAGTIFGGQVDRWRWLQSRVLLGQERPAEALDQLELAIDHCGSNLAYVHAQALLLRQLGRDAEASETFARARTIELCRKRFAEIAFSGVWQQPSADLCSEVADLYRQCGDEPVATSWRRWGDTMRNRH